MIDPDQGDSVEPSTRPHPDAERYFRAVLSDPQIAVLQKACQWILEGGTDWSVNPPTTEERHQLGAAWAVLSNAEVLVP